MPIAPCSISRIIDSVPIGRSITAAMLPAPGVPARVSSGSAPNCSQLQPVVADEQGQGGARREPAAHLDVQSQPALRAQQR